MPANKAQHKKITELKISNEKQKERWKSTYVWALEQDTHTLNNILDGKIHKMYNYYPEQVEDDKIRWYGQTGISNTDKDAIKQLLKDRAKL